MLRLLRPLAAPLGADRDAGHAPRPARRRRRRAPARRRGAARARRRRRSAARALARRLVAGSLDRAVDVAATLELRGYARGVPRACRVGGAGSRHGWRFARRRRRRSSRSRSARGSPASATFDAYPRDRDRRRTRRRSRSPPRCRCSPLAPYVGIGSASGRRLVAERGAIVRMGAFTYSLPGRRRAGAAATSSLEVAPGEFVVLAGRSGSRQVDPAARRLRARARTSTAARSPGALEVGGLDASRARPGRARRPSSATSPRTPRPRSSRPRCAAELELPLELRGEPAGGARPRGRGGGARARRSPHLLDRPTDTLSGGELQRVALAAALVTRPRAGAARRADLAARPGRRRRADLAAAAAERGVGDDRRCSPSTGSSAASPAADRVVALDGGRDRLRRRPARLPRVGAGRATRRWRPPAARLFSLAGLGAAAGVGEGGAARACERLARSRLAGRRRSRAPSRARAAAGSAAGGGARRARPLGRARLRATGRARSCAGSTSRSRRGERVALMGRNGAGKSTLLRAAAGLVEPARGTVEAPGGMRAAAAEPGRLPGPRAGRRRAARRGRAPRRSPRSGSSCAADARPARPLRRRAPAARAGDRAGGPRRATGCRGWSASTSRRAGMDRARKDELCELARRASPARGAAVLVATHDVEFAAALRRRASCCSATAS